jgi:hypothetical protein
MRVWTVCGGDGEFEGGCGGINIISRFYWHVQ